MAYQFTYHHNDSLPALSWCARVDVSSRVVEVEHGPLVDTQPTFFVEGAWPGAFRDATFDRETCFLGSGGKLIDGEPYFFPPTYPTERLHSVEADGALLVSNSLVYLLAASGERLSAGYKFYERDLCTILRGYRKAARSLPTESGKQVSLHYHDGFSAARTPSRPSPTRTQPPHYASFCHYVHDILETLSKLHQNANDAARLRSYDWLSTLSLGYDSPACTILAQQLGCATAVNFVAGRHEHSEDATEIAQRLGVALIQHGRDDYRALEGFPEAEFLASGNGGDDLVYAPLAEILRGRLFVRGDFGDALWSLHSFDVSKHRYGKSTVGGIGGSLGEFRLRAGFVTVSLPLLTYSRLPEIDVISKSSEMEAFRTAGWYDRPIPRRIIEEAGIPRSAFGNRKEAISLPIWALPDPSRGMTDESWRDYLAFAENVASGLSIGETAQALGSECKRRIHLGFTYGKLGWYAGRLGAGDWFRKLDLDVPVPRSACVGGDNGRYLFHWAVERSLERYGATRYSQVPLAS